MQYDSRLADICRRLIPPGKKVLELGCRGGELLSAIEPEVGVGVQLAETISDHNRMAYPSLQFETPHSFDVCKYTEFDYILCHQNFDSLHLFPSTIEFLSPRSRIVVLTIDRRTAGGSWFAFRSARKNPVAIARSALGTFPPGTVEVVSHFNEVLQLVGIPLILKYPLRFLLKIIPMKVFATADIVVVRPLRIRDAGTHLDLPRVSVIVPVRNERGTIARVFEQTPELGRGTELIFVEGGSTDGSYEEIERCMRIYGNRRCILLRQQGRGKGDAVRLGFAAASGDILMILDADLSMAPEDLGKFYEAIVAGRCEFANGSRLALPMERGAMRMVNYLGNHFFAAAISRLLRQEVHDTLCGTKALSRIDYEEVAANRFVFGGLDPFGDFDLLFGAARLNLKILDIPVSYLARTYGRTNIDRWRHGFLLLRMLLVGIKKLRI